VDVFLFQLTVLFIPFIVSRFVSQTASKELNDEQRSLLVDTFVKLKVYGLVLFFIPVAFLYNSIFYLTLYVGVYVLVVLIVILLKVRKLQYPQLFLQRFYIAKAIAFSGLAVYFIIFFYYYF